MDRKSGPFNEPHGADGHELDFAPFGIHRNGHLELLLSIQDELFILHQRPGRFTDVFTVQERIELRRARFGAVRALFKLKRNKT